MATASSLLKALPPELLASIQANLPLADVKNLRLTSSYCAKAFRLYYNRVYLSANSQNIQVLRAIADHPKYRLDVEELIWDDARLSRPRLEPFEDDDSFDYDDINDEEECPTWFEKACEESVEAFKCSRFGDGALPHHLLKRTRFKKAWSAAKSWDYYKDLVADEEKVLRSGADVEALRHALQYFPALTTITITPTAYGRLFLPVYKSPMIRGFPEQLIYPIPRPWPYSEAGTVRSDVEPWDRGQDSDRSDFSHSVITGGSTYCDLWRGYSIVLQALSDVEHNVTNFIIDTRGIVTGVNCYALLNECIEQDNFTKLCAKKEFRRLDLALFMSGLEEMGFAPLRSGKLRLALSAATDMQHFHFITSLEMDISGRMARLQPEDESIDEDLLPLTSMFPVEDWPRLQFFGLTKALVLISDLVGFLEKLPCSVRFIELNSLMFLSQGTYGDLLVEMRQRLDWGQRPSEARPRISISVPRYLRDHTTVMVTVSDQVNRFLYENGKNPFFSTETRQMDNYVDYGVDAVEWDWFEPNHRRPYLDENTQWEQGYRGYMSLSGDND